ncbi:MULTISPECIES: Ig-like domain-containing protein [Rodentibacter]|uniref:Ig-like domain-containing protein n=1 Tax=Rodentibacter TaxID=1960084 RepID=UPI001CFCB234|nr:Ig-like domain-containing protein [Rodentibacter sp. JRC1]GJI56175.1 hypothetical protein HEMROJRC1_12870 [Rodentibacter sp. JRC1]
MAHLLQITTAHKVERITLPSNQTTRIPAEADTQYQLVNENDQPIQGVKSTMMGDDLTVFVDSEGTTLVLENYKTFYPIESRLYLSEQNATLFGVTETVQTAPMQASEVLTLKHLTIFGLGSLALGGILLASKTSKSRGSSNDAEQAQTEQPIPEQPKVEQPQAEQPIPEQPKVEQPQAEKPIPEQPKVEQPQAEKPIPEQPKVEQPQAEKPIPEQPKVEQPQAEKPIPEQPKVEQPQAEQPISQQPKKEQPLVHPTITFDTITDDNVINIKESQADIEITGNTTDVPNGSELAIKLGDEIFKVTVNDNRFSTFIRGEKLARQSKITAEVTVSDNVGHMVYGNAEKAYEVNTTLPEVAVTINPINDGKILNQANQEQGIVLSGTVNVADDVNVLAVLLSVGERQDEPAQLNGKTWSLNMFGAHLTAADTPTVVVKAIVSNAIGNTVEGTAQQTYTVDVTPPVAQLMLNDITADNVINIEEAKGTILLSGKATGEFRTGDIVRLTVDEQTIGNVALSANGEFSLDVMAEKLIGHRELKASLGATDSAENQTIVTQIKVYDVDLHINQPEIITIKVANDNFINVNEGKTDVVVSGIVKNVADGVKVRLEIGEFSKEVEVQNGQFSTMVSPEVMLANRVVSATVTNTDAAGNRAEDSQTQDYEVDANLVAAVDITSIGQYFGADLAKTTRISGTVEFDGVYAQGQNPRMLRAVNVVIGDKTYTTGFDGKTKSFYLDIPNAELAQLNGETVSINFLNRKTISYMPVSETAPVNLFENVHTLDKQRDGSYQLQSLGGSFNPQKGLHWNPVEVQVKSFKLDSTALNDDNQVDMPPSQIQIFGNVWGDAKEGDQVLLKVGEQTFETKVKSDYTFSLEVSSADLAKHKEVQAVLKTQDIAGNAISVQTVENYIAPNTVSSEFVSQREVPKAARKTDHTKEDYNFPYFVNGLLFEPDLGINVGLPVGGKKEPLEIKYHFMTAEEAAKYPVKNNDPLFKKDLYFDYTENHKQSIRDAYQVYEKYLNVKFIETNNIDEAQARHYLGEAEVDAKTGAVLTAIGNFGHIYNTGLVWNRLEYITKETFFKNQIAFANIHEIGHNFHLVHTEHGDKTPIAGFENEANSEFSVMSYNTFMATHPITGVMLSGYSPMRLFDLAALHYRYGVNPNSRAGNDTYGFRDYNGLETDGALYIWDGDGIDTFDASNEKVGVNVDLTPGSWIYRGTERKKYFLSEGRETLTAHEYFDVDSQTAIKGQFTPELSFSIIGQPTDTKTFQKYVKDQAFIGFGTQIENLIGSDYDDVLTGNNADNNIEGGAGDDLIKGGAGNDYLNGGKGADEMHGGTGDDTFVVDNEKDKVVENADEGTDTIISHIDYVLPDNVENLTLVGIAAEKATGNALDNILTANNIGNTLIGGAGNDRLIGGSGADTLTGGDGSDTFVFQTELNGEIDTITDFGSEDKIALSSVIFTAVSEGMANFNDYIQYDSESGQLSYDADAQGGRDGVHFATLSTGLNLNQNQFEIV